MSARRDRASVWVGWSRNVLVVILGIWYVIIAFADPTAFHVTIAIIWATLALAMCWATFVTVTGRRRPAVTRMRVHPETVPFDDVVAAIETTPGRIEAIHELREQHPGLGLTDAVDLVDEVMARPDL